MQTSAPSLAEVPIASEQEDRESSLYTYEILTYPADYTLEVLVGHYHKGTITVPEEQRKFIWSQTQSSKLIESFLMGLPVPPVYFYQQVKGSKLQVVDGLQRLLSIVYFFSGFFGETKTPTGEPVKKMPPGFSLIGLHKKSPFLNRTYEWLQENDEEAFDKFQNAVLRSFVMKQLQPKDNTSIFQVFERLNSGGMVLQGQEIRNCIYTGPFNKLLKKLNSHQTWRQILGTRTEDKRMRDMELILRVLALFSNLQNYRKPMKEFLNEFMEAQRDLPGDTRTTFTDLFKRTSDAIVGHLGVRPFHIKRGINVAVFDSVFVAFARHINEVAPLATPIPGSRFMAVPVVPDEQKADKKARLQRLLEHPDYVKSVSSATTDDQVVKDRIQKAEEILFG